MPVAIKGVIELRQALAHFAPDIHREMNKEIKGALNLVVKDARALVPTRISGLSQWSSGQKSVAGSNAEAAFRQNRFPLYAGSRVKAGIKASTIISKPQSNGWVSVYSIHNFSAAGSIFETAGRTNSMGQKWVGPNGKGHGSHSRNPNAGYHFNVAINSASKMKGFGKIRGRLLYRAWNENGHYTLTAVETSILKAIKQFEARTNAAKSFNGSLAA